MSSSENRPLFEETDIKLVFFRGRVLLAAGVALAGVIIGAVWTWPSGFAVAGVAAVVSVDAIRRLRSGRFGNVIVPIAIDVAAIAVAIIVAPLPTEVVVPPMAYSLLAAVLLLERRRALLIAGLGMVATLAVLISALWRTAEMSGPGHAWAVSLAAVALYLGQALALAWSAAAALRERRALDQRLREREALFQTTLAGAPIVLFAMDAAGVFTLSEGSGLEGLGLRPGQVVGRSAFDLFADAPSIAADIRTVLERGEPLSVSTEFEGRTFDVRYSPIVDGPGMVGGLRGVAVDVTERASAEARLWRRMAFEQLIARLSTDLITRDPEETDAAVERALGEVGRFLGIERSGVLLLDPGGASMSRTHAWCAPGVDAASSFLEHGTRDEVPELYRTLETGRILRIQDAATASAIPPGLQTEAARLGIRSFVVVPMMDRGALIGLVLFAFVHRRVAFSDDDTVLLRLVGEMIRNSLQRARVDLQLRELVASKDQFIASVSHELRTPLTAIVGLAEELTGRAHELHPEEVHEFHALIASQGAEMTNIVDDLLVVARADIDAIRFSPTAVDVDHEIHSVVSGLPSRVMRIDASGAVWADPARFRQIVRNLVTNAVRYGGDRIEVVAGPSGPDVVEVIVRDNGVGVPAGEEDLVFMPYHRSRQESGLPGSIGLGLTVSRKLAELMGGTVTYRRAEGWSSFALQLPSAPVAAPVL